MKIFSSYLSRKKKWNDPHTGEDIIASERRNDGACVDRVSCYISLIVAYYVNARLRFFIFRLKMGKNDLQRYKENRG